MTTDPLVASLSQLDRGSLSIAGGKGANLGELLAAGVPVPDGFVVTTAAYSGNIQTGGIAETVARQAESGAFSDLRSTIEAV
ncbi:MAG: PEP/pyruvate-binding domain-containing protein, partial [Stackebrandtia sp.]